MSERDRLALCAALATAATASALFSVFIGARWVPAVLGVIAVVAAVGIAARRLRLPAALVPVAAAVGVVGYVTAVFASSTAVAAVVPGPAAQQVLRARLDEGFADIQALAPPVPSRPGVLLVTVAGVGAVALAVDLLAATLRRPPLAGIPLLALFAVPSALAPRGGGIVPFALAVTGYLGLLAADSRERVARWGRPLRTTAQLDALSRLAAGEDRDEAPTGGMGRRIGLGAIGLALVVPVLLPGLRAPFSPGGGGTGSGSGRGTSVTTYNPIVRLKDQLTAPNATPLLRVRPDREGPTGYLRMAGLDVFDGRTWSQGPLRASKDDRISNPAVLPRPAVPGPTATALIQVSGNLDARWLPLPYQPTQVRIRGDWRYENRTGTVFSTRDNTRGQAYTVAAARLAANPTALNAAQLSPNDQAAFSAYLAYPRSLPRVIRATADGVVRRAKATTPYQQAVALQDYFRSGDFTYSLRVPSGNSDDAIVNFLQVRQGFCEQFAATMALFARMQGIPARVAVGFTYGERAADGDYVVTSKDAHAWPELYFAGAGWLPFEPTPVAGRGTTVPPAYTRGAQDGGAAAGGDFTTRDTPNRALADRRSGNRVESSGTTLPPASTATPAAGGRRWLWIGGGVGVAALLLTPATVAAVTRKRRWRRAYGPPGAAHAAWTDVTETARDLGLQWPASSSPRAAAAGLRARVVLPAAVGAALDAVVTAEERASFQRPAPAGHPTDAPGDALRTAAGVVRRHLLDSATPRRRWAARLVPPSALDRLRQAGTALAAAGDRADRALAGALRGRMRRRPAPR